MYNNYQKRVIFEDLTSEKKSPPFFTAETAPMNFIIS